MALSNLSFAEAVIGIVLAWVLVALWVRVVENLAYGYLALNRDSTRHALLVAVVSTAVLIIYVALANPGVQSQIENFV
jgi:hypothetical protein